MGRRRREKYEPATWRLLKTGFLDGALNMAIDEALMESVSAGESLPVVRFYGWEPACLSLGIAQLWDDADLDACAELGWDVVRRATGGRAILHTDELTYSVCAPKDEVRVLGSVLESYRRLSVALALGLRLMGLDPTRVRTYYDDHGEPGPACFDGPSDYEITIGQRKLVGSAQVRKKGCVLQHGSLPLFGDIRRIADGLLVDLPGQRLAIQMRLLYRATTLAASLGRETSFDEALGFMQRGFEEGLDLSFEAGVLTEKELARARVLREEKYGTEAWTMRR